jgi:hypothetical protein
VVPELLAITGLLVTLSRRMYWPLAIVSLVAASAYVWWFLAQDSWALKTKYLLFLLPVFTVYTITGAAFLWRRVPWLGVLAGTLMTTLLVVTSAYLLAFDLG